MELGLKLVKIHSAIEFRQSKWLKPFVDVSNDFRKNYIKIGNKTASKLFKGCPNNAFGKFCQNQYKHMDLELVNDENIMLKRCAKANFKSATIFHDDLMAISFSKKSVMLDKHPIVAFCILELSKFWMYNFFYKIISPIFDVEVLGTDTDSLFLAFYNETRSSYYEKLKGIKQHYDFSTLEKTHPLFDDTNQGLTGLMKPEIKHDIHGFVGLRAKMYCFKFETLLPARHKWKRKNGVWTKSVIPSKISLDVKRRCKGVKKRVKDQQFTFDSYKKCLFTQQSEQVKQRMIRSDHHRLHTAEQVKIGLSAFDDKRLLINAIDTVPHGHYLYSQSKCESKF